MGNRPYLRTILGGTDFRSLSLMEKIICINVVLLWLCKRHPSGDRAAGWYSHRHNQPRREHGQGF